MRTAPTHQNPRPWQWCAMIYSVRPFAASKWICYGIYWGIFFHNSFWVTWRNVSCDDFDDTSIVRSHWNSFPKFTNNSADKWIPFEWFVLTTECMFRYSAEISPSSLYRWRVEKLSVRRECSIVKLKLEITDADYDVFIKFAALALPQMITNLIVVVSVVNQQWH